MVLLELCDTFLEQHQSVIHDSTRLARRYDDYINVIYGGGLPSHGADKLIAGLERPAT